MERPEGRRGPRRDPPVPRRDARVRVDEPPGLPTEEALRAAQGDTISVEWTSQAYRTADGEPREGRAAEVWTLRGDLVIEWHAFYHRVDEDT